MIFPAQNVSSAEVEKSKPEVSQIAFQSSLTPTIYCFLCCPWSCPPELCSVPTSAPNMRPSPIFLNLLMLFNSVQSLSCVWLFGTRWNAAGQDSLSVTNSWSMLKLMSIALVMPSNHLILSSPSPAFSLSQHQGLFQWVSSPYQVAKILELQLQQQSFQWIFRTDFL